MTEITKINEEKFTPTRTSHLITSMLLGPFLPLLISALLPATETPLVLITFFALIFGLPSYLCLGLPVMIRVLRHKSPSVFLFAGTAFLVQLCITVVTLILPEVPTLSMLVGLRQHLEATAMWGLIFAPLWAFCSGLIYQYLLKSANPIAPNIGEGD